MRPEQPRGEHDQQHADEQHAERFNDAFVQVVDHAFGVTSHGVAKAGRSRGVVLEHGDQRLQLLRGIANCRSGLRVFGDVEGRLGTDPGGGGSPTFRRRMQGVGPVQHAPDGIRCLRNCFETLPNFHHQLPHDALLLLHGSQ